MSEKIEKEENNDETEPQDETASTEESAKPPRSKKLIIIIGAVLVLILIAAGVIFFTPLGKKILGTADGADDEVAAGHGKKEEIDVTKVEFATLPEVLINLRSSDGKSAFLKATFILECPNGEVAKKTEKIKPLLVDQIQVYLRELEVEDLRGSAGMQRIRQELISRCNTLLSPDKIRNILFKEFLVQ